MAASASKTASKHQKEAHKRTSDKVSLPASPQKKKAGKQEKDRGKARAHAHGAGQAGPSHVAHAKPADEGTDAQEWSWLSVTDAPPSRQPPVFTKDGSYFFTIVGSSVKVYSDATGNVVSTLSSGAAGSHTDAITSAILNPHNAFQIVTGSVDGCIKVWDFLDGVLLQTVDVEKPVLFLVAHALFKDVLFASVGRRKKVGASFAVSDDCRVLRVSLLASADTADRGVHKPADTLLIGKTRQARGLAMSSSGAWLVAVAGHKSYVASTENLSAGFTKFVSPEALTCLAFHPTEEYFATGDAKGVIRLWYCLNTDMTTDTAVGVEKRAPTTTFHWHAHAVSGLAFTPNGAYLLSGGEESVMVIWQLHTGKKEFVARVGGPILSIATSRARQEEYLLGLADASFVFINSSSLKVARTISRVKLDPAVSASAFVPSGTPLAVHPLSHTIVLPSSHPSSLQSYSPSQMKLVAELEVSPSNRVSRRDDKALQPSVVERAVVSPSGEWMATVDAREGDDSFRGEAYLKIWRWDATASFWELNTRIDRPHGLTAITALSFSSQPNNLLVSTGKDGLIKIWRLKIANERRSASAERFWVLRSTLTFRDETPSHASWSPDGSMLAVSLGPYIALYDAASNMLVHPLTARESCSHVVSAHFMGDSGRYLVAVGTQDVLLWDLVSLRVLWHTRMEKPISNAVAHPTEDRVVILEQLPVPKSEDPVSRATTFGSASSAPLKRATVPFNLRATAWYPPSTSDHQPASFSLVGITDAHRLVLFGDEVTAVADPGASANALGTDAGAQAKSTLFQDIFGRSAFADVASEPPPRRAGGAKGKGGAATVADVLDFPAYLLPSVDTIFDTVMGSLLQPRPAEKPVAPVQVEEALEDERMEVEEQPVSRSFVEDEEVGMLVELFRDVAVKGLHDPSVRLPHPTEHFGAPPPLVKRRKNAGPTKPRTPPPEPQDTSMSYPSPESTPSLTAAPAPAAGKKRRKSQAS